LVPVLFWLGGWASVSLQTGARRCQEPLPIRRWGNRVCGRAVCGSADACFVKAFARRIGGCGRGLAARTVCQPDRDLQRSALVTMLRSACSHRCSKDATRLPCGAPAVLKPCLLTALLQPSPATMQRRSESGLGVCRSVGQGHLPKCMIGVVQDRGPVPTGHAQIVRLR